MSLGGLQRCTTCFSVLANAARAQPGITLQVPYSSSREGPAVAVLFPRARLTVHVVVGCRELDELTFFDAGPKPDWSKDKSPGFGRLDFLRPGGFHMVVIPFRPQAANPARFFLQCVANGLPGLSNAELQALRCCCCPAHSTFRQLPQALCKSHHCHVFCCLAFPSRFPNRWWVWRAHTQQVGG